MEIDRAYLHVLAEIEKGHRGLVRFTADELEVLEQELRGRDLPRLEKVLCLIDHSAVPHLGFEAELIALLKAELPAQLKVFVLNCVRKHVLQARGQKGQRLTFDFLEALKALLFAKDPMVVEWTLRTIEECGSQGVYFLREFDKIKPAPWKWFNEHQRAVREIIAMLERRWSQFEHPKK